MKRLLLGLAVVFSLGLILCGSYFLWQWQSDKAVQSVLRTETKVAEKSFAIKHQDKQGHSYYLTPDGKKSALYKEMQTWNLASLSKRPLPGGQLTIVRAEKQSCHFNNVQKISLHQVVYQKQLFTYQKLSDTVLRDYYAKADQSRFTISDFVNGNMDRIDEEIKKINAEATYNEPDLTADFKANGRASDVFDYTDGKLILGDSLEIPVENLFDVVNASYLAEKDLEAYNVTTTPAAEEAAKEPMTGNVVALTFDDGPDGRTTPQALDILAKYQIPGTFFVIGRNVAGNEEILKRMTKEGHEIGNHTWSHPSLTSLNLDQVAWEGSETNKAVEAATGVSPKIFRPPYGATNAAVQASMAMHQTLWTVDTLDWQNHNTQAILANVQAQTTPGGVILMHDIHQTTIDALPTVIEYLKGQGYQFVTVSQLYGY